MNRTLALASAALALAACSPDFDPASKVDKLRVLAIKAEPPEIAPPSVDPDLAHTAALTSLVLRADFDAEPARTTTVVYLACVPTPGDPTPNPCVVLAALRDPTVMLEQAAQASCGSGGDGANATGVAFAGVEACGTGRCGAAFAFGTALPAPEVALPPGFLFDLPSGSPELTLGVQAVVLAFALDATPEELVAGVGTSCPAADVAARLAELWSLREHVLATKRVQIRGPDAPDPRNENPEPVEIEAGGTTLDPSAPTTVTAGIVLLTPVPPPDAHYQVYTKLDAAGAPIETTTEEWVYSWFSTAGDIDELHTRGATADEWKVYGPGGYRAVVAAVVRDLRGGVAWTVRDVTVAP